MFLAYQIVALMKVTQFVRLRLFQWALVATAIATASATAVAAVNLKLVSPVGGTALPFTVGQAFKKGEVPASSAVVADISTIQALVKNRWPDGTAKFAIVSGHVTLSANTVRTINLRAGTPTPAATPISLANLQATGVSASIWFSPFGTVSWAGTQWTSPALTLASGPEMSAWVFRKPIGTDPHLVAWLEVRAYKGGRVNVLPWIENGYLRVAGPTEKIGTATFILGGTQRFSQALTLLNHQRAVLASGTTLTHWYRGDPQITARHDTTHLMATKMAPNYRAITPATSPLFARLPASYIPLDQAGYPLRMGQPGYHPSIGLLPEWDVAYLTTGADPRAWRGIMINAYCAGRYGIHFRDETTQRPLAFSTYPDLVMGSGAGTLARGASSKNLYTPPATGTAPPIYGSTHHPSMGYMAYLLSGWNYFLEEMQLLATANFLKNNNFTRQFTLGIFETYAGANGPRGAAWAIRTLLQAATITPDADPLRAQFVNSVVANVNYYHGRYVAIPNNPLGLVQPYPHGDYVPGGVFDAPPWQDDFVTATFGYIKELEVSDPATQVKLSQFLAWKYRSVVGRLGGSVADIAIGYPNGALYTLFYSPTDKPDWTGGKGPWYANWAAVAQAMQLPAFAAAGAPLLSGHPIEATYYWGNLMPALSYAVDHGAPGAAAGWDRVTTASNFPIQAADYIDNPVWGVRPRTRQ